MQATKGQPAFTMTFSETGQITGSDGSQDVAMEDWDTLFDAVVGRLQAGVDSCNAVAPLQRLQSWPQIRAQVLECVEALDQLHVAATRSCALNR